MRIAKVEDLHCNAGWRDFSFLKITGDDGTVGWSEFMENFGAEGLSTVIQRLGERIIGMDPRAVEKVTAFLHGLTRQSPYGINQQAIAAIENALVDLKAKSLGIPVYELLGGPVRERLQLVLVALRHLAGELRRSRSRRGPGSTRSARCRTSSAPGRTWHGAVFAG